MNEKDLQEIIARMHYGTQSSLDVLSLLIEFERLKKENAELRKPQNAHQYGVPEHLKNWIVGKHDPVKTCPCPHCRINA